MNLELLDIEAIEVVAAVVTEGWALVAWGLGWGLSWGYATFRMATEAVCFRNSKRQMQRFAGTVVEVVAVRVGPARAELAVAVVRAGPVEAVGAAGPVEAGLAEGFVRAC